MSEIASILVVDDEPAQRDIIADVLREAGHEVDVAAGAPEARARLSGRAWDVVLTDWAMPDGGGKRVLEDGRSLCPDAPIIVMTAYGSIEGAVEAVRLGACDYLSKPFDKSALLLAVEKGLAHRSLATENRRLRARVNGNVLDELIVGNCPLIQDLKRIVKKAGCAGSNVLITGESGAGKEVVARAIHACGPRPEAPFVAVNCAALPAPLIESTLFGHEKGAFTGADRLVRGQFEQAEDGTLLLDEIGSLPLALQGKLLRALQERVVTRVGGETHIPVRARILAATNCDLAEAVRAGDFREDLYFRLHVLPIIVPPLRDRREDIPLLAAALMTRLHVRLGGPARTLAPAALERLQEHEWRGNVRELENVLERLWVTADATEIGPAEVREALEGAVPIHATGGGPNPDRAGAAVDFLRQAGHTVDELEARLLHEALDRSGGQIRGAAEILGLSYKTMQYRIRKYGIRPQPDTASGEATRWRARPSRLEGGS